MNCEHVQRMLDAYLDHELDEATDAQLAGHASGCRACGALLAERSALRDALRKMPRHEAPARLRTAIGNALSGASVTAASAASRKPSWWQAGAMAASAAGLAFALGLWVASPHAVQDPREPAIAQHLASFANSEGKGKGEGEPRVQIASTDRHVVKPWFAGKLDFAPPVRQFAEQGFTLVGGRIDALDGQPAAVLVYGLRRHHVSLFVSRSPGPESSPPVASTLRGFAVVAWVQDGLSFSAVSDVDGKELKRFADLVQAPAP